MFMQSVEFNDFVITVTYFEAI